MSGTQYSAGGTCYNMGQLNNYVKAKDETHYAGLAHGLVSLLITHSNLNQRWPDISPYEK